MAEGGESNICQLTEKQWESSTVKEYYGDTSVSKKVFRVNIKGKLLRVC